MQEKLDEIINYASNRTEPVKNPSKGLFKRGLITSLALLLFGAGCASVPATKKGYSDTKDNGYQIAQVVNDVDLSEYTKVAEEDGLEVYVSPIRRNVKDWDNVTRDRAKVRKWIAYAYVWDTIINNTNNSGITLNKKEGESLTGKKISETLEGKEFLDVYLRFSAEKGRVYIPPKSLIRFEDQVYLTGDKNKLLKISYFGKDAYNNPVKVSFNLRIN